MSKKAHIRYLYIKLGVFIALAISVFFTIGAQIEHLKPFIGVLMVFYGVEEIIYEILFHRKNIFHESKTYLGLIEFILGIVLISAPIIFEYVCVIWATWSIVRESYEIKEIVVDIKSITPSILSGVESIIVIIFSILLMIEPGEHHAIIHMGLLSVELILNPLVIVIDEVIIDYKERKIENRKI